MKLNVVKNGLLIGVGLVLGLAVSVYYFHRPNSAQAENVQTVKKPLYWVAPMDPNYKRNKPGKSPMGMDLVPVYQEDSGVQGVTISANVLSNIGAKLESVEYRDLSQVIDTLGVVKENDNNIEHLHTYENGWIRKLYVTEIGQKVEKDQLVAQLYSPKLLEAEQELVLSLQEANKISPKTSGRYINFIDYVAAAKAKLEALGISKTQIQRIEKNRKADVLIDIYAPISGVVLELDAKDGMYVTPQQNLMKIVNLNTVWLSAEVFPQQVQYLKIGDEITGHLDGVAHSFKGKITFISPTVDPITKTVSIRATLDNSTNLLKPNLYMDVVLNAYQLPHQLSISKAAVIRLKNIDYVITQNKDNRFIAKEIKLGIATEEYYQVLQGLKVGEKVVTSAQFLIDSESNVQASLVRLGMEKGE